MILSWIATIKRCVSFVLPKLTLVPFCQVSAQHAFKDGEDGKSLAHWRAVHEHVFRLWLAEAHLSFDQNMLVFCEEFDVVYALDPVT